MQVLAIILSSTFISSLLTLFFTRRKRKAETQNIELDSISKITKIWKDLSEEQQSQIELLQEEVRELNASYEGLKRMFEAQCEACKFRKFYEENYKEQ